MSGPAVVTIRRALTDQRWMMYFALVVLNVIDVITTAAVLGRGGVEGNPFVQPLIDGLWQVSLLKAAVLIVIAMLLMRSRESRISALALAAASGWYLAVVLWNGAILAVI